MLNELYSTTTEPPHRRIRITRRALELSQLQVALHAGISQSQFSLFEHGHAHLEPEALDKVCEMLGLSRKGSIGGYHAG
jgi:transcriptional regulator with XRE-family HTH domain